MKGHNYGICLKCGKQHIPNRPNLGKHPTYSDERNHKISVALKGKPKTEEHKRKLSLAKLGISFSGEVNKKKGRPGMLNAFYGHHHSEETKVKLRDVCAQFGYAKDKRKGHPGKSNPFYGKSHTAKARARMSEKKHKLFQDPEYIKRWMVAHQLKPNKGEMTLDSWLQDNLPKEWKYVGDGRDGTSIGGKVPDWININGKKAVIELFGHYWHSLPNQSYFRTPEGTLEHYSGYGFKCLIIDYRELRDYKKTMQRVIEFEETL